MEKDNTEQGNRADQVSFQDLDAEELFPEDFLPEGPIVEVIEPTSKAILNAFFGKPFAWEVVNEEQRRDVMPQFGISADAQLVEFLEDNEL